MSYTAEADIFVSYARRDNSDRRVSDLVALLVEAYRKLTGGEALKVFLDTTDISGMDDWRHRILSGLRSARLLVTFLSPSYFESGYCHWEFDEYLKHEAARSFLGEGIAPICLVDVPGWMDRPISEQIDDKWAAELRRRHYFDFRPWADGIACAKTDSNFMARVEELADRIHKRLSRARKFVNSPGNVDRQNENFVGRYEELRRLQELVRFNKLGVLTAVHGLGGIGKTALATEYAYAFAHEYSAGRWKVECEGREDLRVALSALAGTRDLDFSFTDAEKVDLDLTFERVLRELKTRSEQTHFGRVLLILDNVDQAVLLEPAQIQRLPNADWLDVIVTTRLGENELYGTQNDRAFLPVDELPENDALLLIEKYQPSGGLVETEREAALNIVRLLGGFTLAIETAAVFLGQFAQDVTCSGFRDRLTREGLSGLEKAGDETSERLRHRETSLKATLGATLERLAKHEKLAMTIASLLPSDHVVLPWVRVLTAKEFPEYGTDAEPGYPDPWQSLLRRLLSLRLLQGTAEINVTRMHRLLRQIFRPSVESEATRSAQSTLVTYIRTRADFLWDGWAKRENRWEIAPVVACAWQWIEQGLDEGAAFANQISKPLKQLCRFTEAERLLRKALAMVETRAGPNYPNVATALNNLAQLLHHTGQFLEVEALYRRAIRIDQQYYGARHETVGRDCHNLAQYLQERNRLPEAEELTRRSLTIYKDTVGPSHPSVAICLNSLGKIVAARNDPREAERIYRAALTIYEQVPSGDLHGKYNSDFCVLLDNLAELLRNENRLEESELLLRQALNVRKKVFNLDDPTVANSLYNLASLYYYRGQYKKAECLYRRALANFEKAFGLIHPSVASCLSDLATVLKQTNHRQEAEEKLSKALEIDETNYGPKHPRVAIRLNILAALLQDVGRLVDAESFYRRAILINEESYGPDDPSLAAILNNLANLLQQADRPEEAVACLERALDINEKRFGSNHPKVGTNLNNLAEIYLRQHRYSDALPLTQRALSIQEEALGPEHADLAACLDTLGRIHQGQGKYNEAREVQERAVSIREKSLGTEHPDVAMSLSNLGVTYQHLGQHSRAEECFQRSISAYEKAYGSENANLASMLNNLACFYYKLGQYSKAEPLHLRSLEIWRNVLGPTQAQVALGLTNIAQLYRAEGRYGEAESAFKQALEILLGLSGNQDRNLRHVIRKYLGYLRDRGRDLQDILVLIGEIAQPFGVNLRDLVLAVASE